MLTPIKIRGRRKKPGQNANEDGPRKIPSGPKGGRQLLSRHEIQTSSQKRIDKRARLLTPRPSSTPTSSRVGTAAVESVIELQRRRQKRKLFILESLPVELIEKIFFYSLNVNLPRASVVLNAAVSRERVYRALLLLAFWDDARGTGPGHGDGGRVISRILRPLEYTPLSEEERAALQSTVLRCRWCTLDRVLGLLPDLMNLVIQRCWVQAGVSMVDDQRRALDRFLARQGDENTRVFEGLDSRNESYTLSIVPLVSVTVTHQETGQMRIHRVLTVKNFPSKLLSGNDATGFSEEDCAFLEILRIASGFSNPTTLETNDITLSRESLQTGIHTALTQPNQRALITLLKLDECFVRAQNISTHPSNAPIYTLPPEHFRTAVRMGPSNPEPFQLLLRASAESIPDNDPEITQWAMDLASPLGDWLLDLMMRLPQLGELARANPPESVFYFGAVNLQSEMGRRYVEEISGGEGRGLGGWLGEVSFDVSALWDEDGAR